jgi:hypothetical protein
MREEQVKVSVNGSVRNLLSLRVGDQNVVIAGKFIKLARIHDELFVDGEPLNQPEVFVGALRRWERRPDIFQFAQDFRDANARFSYPMEWDNAAAAATRNYDDWWNKLPQETRKNVRRAARRGVSVRVATFDDELVKGIKAIYDESPFRQGKRFWHFGKDLQSVKRENSTYPERSEFVGAYYKGELIGFLKLVYVNGAARIMQILSKNSHHDKRPMNALIAKAMELCQERGVSHLVYSQFTFGYKNDSQLTEFKRRNGFEELLFPRYYVPLTFKGKIALAMNLHHGALGVLPPRLVNLLLTLRSKLASVRSRLLRRRPLSRDARPARAIEARMGV